MRAARSHRASMRRLSVSCAECGVSGGSGARNAPSIFGMGGAKAAHGAHRFDATQGAKRCHGLRARQKKASLPEGRDASNQNTEKERADVFPCERTLKHCVCQTCQVIFQKSGMSKTATPAGNIQRVPAASCFRMSVALSGPVTNFLCGSGLSMF